mmetsp:Transcript_56979/g.123844  ORF Transcript_56979/g.123844 Transcript_56979/m.123844 type:complete len:315 (+) Transcript_56979:145-1089(+)
MSCCSTSSEGILASWQPIDAPPVPPAEQKCSPCSCYRCLMAPMAGVVFGIIGCNYAPYVLWRSHDSVVDWLAVIVFHVLLSLLIASYLQCVFTDPGTVPMEWHNAIASDPNLAAHHRLCPRSALHRPLRSHYCSVTRRVVLNMDHFCPWVINTVGFYNRKYFVLFLIYTFLTCTWVVITLLPTYMRTGLMVGQTRHWSPARSMVAMMAMLLDATLLVMLLCFGGFHIHMVLYNETTIEGSSPHFDVGPRRNWEQVFGENPWLWFLPVWGKGPAGNGIHWPMNRLSDLRSGDEYCEDGLADSAKLLERISSSEGE